MKKFLTYIIIYCLISNASYSIELQSKGLSVGQELLYAGDRLDIKKPKKLYNLASKYLGEGKYDLAAHVFKDFVDQNPNHKLVPKAIYYYGVALTFNLESYDKFYDSRTTPFKVLINNYPNIVDKEKIAGRTLYDNALEGHLTTLFFVISNLMYDENSSKSFDEGVENVTWNKNKAEELKDFKKEFCDQMSSENPKNQEVIKRSQKYYRVYSVAYESFKCIQIHGGLDEAKRAQTGFKINLLDSNDDLSSFFEKYELIFDFKNFQVQQIVSLKETISKEVGAKRFSRRFEILKIGQDEIKLQQTKGEVLNFCRNLGWGNNTPFLECNVNSSKEFFEKSDGTSMYEPYVYLDFQLKSGEISTTYLPLAKKKTQLKKQYYKESFKDEKVGDIIKIMFLAATIYLVATQIGTITKIAKGSGGGSKIASKASGKAATTSSTGLSGASIQKKYKILKYYGFLR